MYIRFRIIAACFNCLQLSYKYVFVIPGSCMPACLLSHRLLHRMCNDVNLYMYEYLYVDFIIMYPQMLYRC